MTRFDGNWKPPKIEDGVVTRWGWMVKGVKYFHLGEYTDIGFGCYFKADKTAEIFIGNYVQIGGGTKVYAINTINNTQGPIIIEDEAKIGANSVILPNIHIKKAMLIPALSIVLTEGGAPNGKTKVHSII